jgi:serine/threonine protein kinase
MNFAYTVAGQKYKWSLETKLGEGDAGEIYLVQSLLQGEKAVLKRPRQSSFSDDILRQASQIRSEGKILAALQEIAFPVEGICLRTPALLDQSPPEAGSGDRFFIVLEQAAGFDLRSLSRLAHGGGIEESFLPTDARSQAFIDVLTGFKKVPEPILVRSLLGIVNLLESIHFTEVLNDELKQAGLIWNDVKPEHLYWDPLRVCVTVIDWGNGYFLESDGITRDRQHSRNDDVYQFIQSFGPFLSESNPELYRSLDWPQDVTPASAASAVLTSLKGKIQELYAEIASEKEELRRALIQLYDTPRAALSHLSKSAELRKKAIWLGELPDFSSEINFHARIALKLASENRLESFRNVCEQTAKLPMSDARKWSLLAELAGIPLTQGAGQAGDQGGVLPANGVYSRALTAGVTDDWPALLWELFVHIGENPAPDWWQRISQAARRIFLNLDKGAIAPFYSVSRSFYTFQSILQQTEAEQPHSNTAAGHRSHSQLLKIFEDEVIRKWKELDPAPPNSGLSYGAILGLLEDLELLLPGEQDRLAPVIKQLEAQADLVLEAWDRKDFETARKALKMVLIWDPDLRRILRVDRSIEAAPRWLMDVRRGAGTDEPFYNYLTIVELAGRNLRNSVGKAKWLDLILDALKRLRKGTSAADLMIEHPEITGEIPWLNEYRSREILSLSRTRPLALERDPQTPTPMRTILGTVEGVLGPGRDLHLGEPLDSWIPEARGSSARVFAGLLRDKADKPVSLAVKIIRPDQLEYALPLFREEAQILSVLRDVPGVSPMVECGFLKLADGQEWPAEDRKSSADSLRGSVIRYGSEAVQNFLAGIERQLASGWLLYLALVRRAQNQNLMVYCDAGHTHGWFLSLRESLLLSIQICDILQHAHDRNIVYRDHKLLHYYWEPEAHGVVMIDWNIANRQAQGLSDSERQFDIVQFGARAFHHILTGRPAPGALPLGPNRPEDIENAALKYPVNWTYDDERLPAQVKEILENVLNQGYAHLKDLREDLAQIFRQLPEPAQAVAS